MATLVGILLLLQDPPAPAGSEFFEKNVRPLLAERCYSCHSARAGKTSGGLALDSRDGLLKGGDSGPGLVPGDPDRSLLIKAVRHEDDTLKMPKKEKLREDQIGDLIAWIKMGAPDPRTRAVSGTGRGAAGADAAPAGRAFWSFQAPGNIVPPEPADASWCRTPVDRFILAGLRERGLTPAPEAERRVLLRRVAYDLTGLPPSPEETDAFLSDRGPDAYERVVERLLASPRYGERWARHWLDVARYADTKDWVFDEELRFPYAYAYRNWVVRALNEDMPYDRFLLLQLAADRVATGPDLAAMGFLTVGRLFLNRAPDIIDDRIDVVSRGLLGLTVSCARCHDHKYDPISTRDYYSLYGIFASSSVPKELPLLGEPARTPEYAEYLVQKGAREREAERFIEARRRGLTASYRSPEQIVLYLLAAERSRGKADEEAKKLGLHPAMLRRWIAYLKHAPPELDHWRRWAARTAPLLAFFTLGDAARAYTRDLIPGALDSPEFPANVPLQEVEEYLKNDEKDKLRKLRRTIQEAEFLPGAPARAMVLEENAAPFSPRVFIRGNPRNQGEEVPRQFLAVLSPGRRTPFATGGRLDLARAVVSPENPLTARVLVNRVWMHHFGRGLVATPSDFGARGDRPTHPELLDWLARELVQGGWSLKRLHRAIVLSSTYRQSSRETDEGILKDSANTLLWRQNRRRLDVEALRDSILCAAGSIDLNTGGTPADLTTSPFSTRRTLYGCIDRINLPEPFKSFDFAVPDMHSPGRHQTAVPQQALFLMNGPFLLEQACTLARRTSGSDPAGRIGEIYARALGRPPTDAEIRRAAVWIAHAPAPAGPPPSMDAWEKFAHVLLESNEFMFLD